MYHRLWLAACVAAFGSLPAAAASLIPLADDPGGQSAVTSARQWTQWTLLFDQVVDGGDPISDATGEFQSQKQIYPLTFLGGAQGDGVTRAFTVPSGKPIFLPMLNVVCTSPFPDFSCSGDAQDLVRGWIDDADSLKLTVDGVDLIRAESGAEVDDVAAGSRVFSGIFTVESVNNNWLGDPAGVYDNSFVDGYFAALKLPVGVHTVSYGGGIGSLEFSNSVEATIVVAPIPAPVPAALLMSGLLALAGFRGGARRQA